MSWRVVSQVALIKGITPPERVVLLGMAHLALHDGSLTGLNMKQLADWCDMSERGVRGIIRRLEKTGLCVCHEARGRGHSNSYTMTLPEANKTGSNVPINEPETGTDVPVKGDVKPEREAQETGTLVPIKPLKPEREPLKTGTHVPPNCRTVSKTEAVASVDARETKPARDSPRKKSRIPEHAVPTERDYAAAERRNLSREEADAQFERFKNHHLANGKLFADWGKAWITWLDSPYFRPVLGTARPAFETAYDRRKRDREEADAAERAEAERLARFYGSGP